MKHQSKTRKLSLKTDQRRALLLSLARNFFVKGKIHTTQAKAKEIRPMVERIISKAKQGDLASRRMLLRYFSPVLTKKIVEEVAPLYKSRTGGYTRIIRLGERKSDSAQTVVIELVK